MDIERKQREIDHWIASCERSKPLLEGYTRRVLCYDNSQESYIELSQMLASRLIEPLLKEKSEEKVKFGAAFIGMGYSLAAIYRYL